MFLLADTIVVTEHKYDQSEFSCMIVGTTVSAIADTADLVKNIYLPVSMACFLL